MKKINSIQTKDYIAGILRDYIIQGKFEPNEEIVQEDLTEKLGLSRTPIREALQALEQDGFLERLSNRHMKVIPLTAENIHMNFQVIAKIEGEIIQIIMEKQIEIDRIMEIKNSYDKAISEGNLTLSQEKELQVHLTFSEMIGNLYLTKLHLKLMNGFPKYAITDESAVIGCNRKHLGDIIDALKNKNIEKMMSANNLYFKQLANSIIKDEHK
ncbi:MAG: GntR family transcriptional regulator [Clostridiaceae bacterium]